MLKSRHHFLVLKTRKKTLFSTKMCVLIFSTKKTTPLFSTKNRKKALFSTKNMKNVDRLGYVKGRDTSFVFDGVGGRPVFSTF